MQKGKMATESRKLLGIRVDRTSYPDAANRVIAWAREESSRYVCVAPVSSVMEAYDDLRFEQIINAAALVTPDGVPVVWALRLLGLQNATRVYGPDLTLEVLRIAEREGIPVGFYGAEALVLERLLSVLAHRFPLLKIAYAFSPPFRPLSSEEDADVVEEVGRSGARILFVGIGSPKQEYWMAAHQGCIQGVMIGVGAAFDFLAGTKPQAPRWMMRIGMEWFFRLATEPRRLWKRYLKQNPRYVVFFILQLLRWKSAQPQAATPIE